MLILGAAAATIIAVLGAYAWDADRALERDKKALVTAELQRDSFAKGLKQCKDDVAERNQRWAAVSSLPEVRLRLCAQRQPTDGCCKVDGECTP